MERDERLIAKHTSNRFLIHVLDGGKSYPCRRLHSEIANQQLKATTPTMNREYREKKKTERYTQGKNVLRIETQKI